MPSPENYKSLRVKVTDDARKDAIIDAAQKLRGLGWELTVTNVARLAAGKLGLKQCTVKSYIQEKMEPEDVAVLGIIARSTTKL